LDKGKILKDKAQRVLIYFLKGKRSEFQPKT